MMKLKNNKYLSHFSILKKKFKNNKLIKLNIKFNKKYNNQFNLNN